MKNSVLGPGSKMGHFSYLGDAQIGEDVNIGAGTITCNFDGVNKHKTVIEDGAFIGSDSMLVAPLHIGRGAKTGAGSVVTHDVPAGAVAYGVPARHQTWQSPREPARHRQQGVMVGSCELVVVGAAGSGDVVGRPGRSRRDVSGFGESHLSEEGRGRAGSRAKSQSR